MHGAGANNITLDGVFHSMSRVGTYSEAAEVVWYGSEAVIDHWLSAALLTSGRTAAAGGQQLAS